MDKYFASAEFWGAVAFLIFVAIVGYFGYRRIVDALDTRATNIKTELDEAMRLREEAQTLLVDYQRQQRDAAAQAQEIIGHAKLEAERLASEAEAELEADVLRRRRLASDKIARAEAEAINEVRNSAAALAVNAARHLIRDLLDENSTAKLIKKSINELPKKIR